MEKVLLNIIAVSGLCAVSSHLQHHYHFVYDLKNWTEAQSYCREKYTDLVTIGNMEDVNILNNKVDLNKLLNSSEYGYRAWIGLYDDMNSWRWSLSDTSFYKHGEAEFRRWEPGQPENYGGESCTCMFSDGQWHDYSCPNRLKAACLHVRGQNVTFILTVNTMMWPEAQSYCREHYTDLASVRNLTENQRVQELVPHGERVWIGLFRDSWKWSDGSNSSFRLWGTGEPHGFNETCAAADFSHSGQWEDWTCSNRMMFICYSVPALKHVMKVRLVKKSSSVDLNDPAVMEDILKQLKERMKDQGMNDDIKLSWKKQPDGKVFHKEKKTKKKNSSTNNDEI